MTDDYSEEEIKSGILFRNIEEDIQRYHLLRPVLVTDDNLSVKYVM